MEEEEEDPVAQTFTTTEGRGAAPPAPDRRRTDHLPNPAGCSSPLEGGSTTTTA